MKFFSSSAILRNALILVPSVALTVLGCGGSASKAPNEVVPVDKAAVQSKEKMIQDAYKNQKPAKTEAQSKADLIKGFQKSAK